MKCPVCGIDNTTVSSGHHTEKGNYQRYKRCNNCGHRFKTIEYYVPNVPREKRQDVLSSGNVRLIYYNDNRGRLIVKEAANEII